MLQLHIGAQSFKQRLVYGCTDSTVWLSEEPWIQTPDSFLLRQKKGDSIYFINAHGTQGPFKYRGSRGTIRKYQLFGDSLRWYYQSDKSPLYGPLKGEGLMRLKNTLSDNERFFVEPVWYRDSIRFYANGRLVTTVDTLTKNAKNPYNGLVSHLASKSNSISSSYDQQADCSNNGNHILAVENELKHFLYVNGQLTDSGEERFTNLMINDLGDYLYGYYGRYPAGDTMKYAFTVASPDTSYITGGYFNYRYLAPDGGYFLQGRKDNKAQLLINGKHFTGLDQIGEKRLAAKGHFLFECQQDSQSYINADGILYPTKRYKKIYYPTIDDQGNFSCYGLRDYYLYRVVNGREQPAPLSAYGVRAQPLYISADGHSTHVFITDDSTYLYRDGRLLLPPASNHQDSIYLGEHYYTFFRKSYEHLDAPREDRELMLLTISDRSYLIYKGCPSRPLLQVRPHRFGNDEQIGEIYCSELSGQGYFAIQKTGPRRYLIIVNNSYYKEIDGIDKIFEAYSLFDRQKLVFNGIIDKSLYQFEWHFAGDN